MLKNIYKNLDLLRQVPRDDGGMPIIRAERRVPKILTAFCDVRLGKQAEDSQQLSLPLFVSEHSVRLPERYPDKAVHFFLHDRLFERVWMNPRRYTEQLRRYGFVLSPDFSLYADMSVEWQRLNVFRNRLLGAWWQSQDLRVIPTISWSGRESHGFCFLGVEPGGAVAIGPRQRNSYRAAHLWDLGAERMVKELRPTTILVYGVAREELLRRSAGYTSDGTLFGVLVKTYPNRFDVLREEYHGRQR